MNLMSKNFLSTVTLATLISVVTLGSSLSALALTLTPDRRINLSGRFLSGFLETDSFGELSYSIDVIEIPTADFLFPAITYDSSLPSDSFDVENDTMLVLTKRSADWEEVLKLSFPEGVEDLFASRDRGDENPPLWRIKDAEHQVSPNEPYSFLGLLVLGALGAGKILKKKLTLPKQRKP